MASAAPPRVDEVSPPPAPRWRFSLVIAILVVTALLIVAAVEFPPSPPPISYSFVLVAGLNGTTTFNGTTPGPAITVSLDARVTVKLVVAASASGPHSWMLVPLGGTPASPAVFLGAYTASPTVGTAPGGSAVVTFTATRAGSYTYISGVDSDYLDGMWGYLNVTV